MMSATKFLPALIAFTNFTREMVALTIIESLAITATPTSTTTILPRQVNNRKEVTNNGTVINPVSKCEFVRLVCQLSNSPPLQFSIKSKLTNNSNSSTFQHQFTRNVFTTAFPFQNISLTQIHPLNSSQKSSFQSPQHFSIPPHLALINPFHPRFPPPPIACNLHKTNCQPPTDIDFHLHIAVAVFAAVTFLLNIFVIGRILSQNIKKVHQSKVYFLSMAVADLYYGLCSFLNVLVVFHLIPIPKDSEKEDRVHKWFVVSISLSFSSSIFHVLCITIDRFMATTFPFFHKVHVTRRKVLFTVGCLWMLAVLLALLPLKSSIPSEFNIWFNALVGAAGYVILIGTYIHISIVAMQRRKTLRSLRRSKPRRSEGRGSKYINTTFLSVSITFSYIACNSFGISHAFLYLFGKVIITKRLMMIDQLLLNINASVNPILYTIVEAVHKKFVVGSKSTSTKSNRTTSSQGATITTGRRNRKQSENISQNEESLGLSKESLATVASTI